MKLNSKIIFSLFFVLLTLSCKILSADIEIKGVRTSKPTINNCLLPDDHPLQNSLQDLFKQPKMFVSNHYLKKAGFETLNRDVKPLMVARHPNLNGYIIKKFKNSVSLEKQKNLFLKRIQGARMMQKFIKINQLQHIVVPRKWLYELPKQFSHGNIKSYLLIAEDMDICSGENARDGEIASKYYNLDYDVLKELCLFVYYFRGMDSSLRNMPFTNQNKIAFIDIEHWDDWGREGYLHFAMKFLSPDRQDFAKQIFKELREQDQK